MWDVITHPKCNGGLTKSPLTLSMDNNSIPYETIGVITYPYPNLDAGLANFC